MKDRRVSKRMARKKLRKHGSLIRSHYEHWLGRDFAFWVAQGVNYLNSDLSTGVWSPVVETLYSAPTPPVSTLKSICVQKFYKGSKGWSNIGVATWIVLKPEVAYRYYRQALERLIRSGVSASDAESLIKEPYNEVLWAFFHEKPWWLQN